MIVCPNCNHHNLDGASHCEHCYTPLPVTSACPNCGATVQSDAHFCGQCGFKLANSKAESGASSVAQAAVISETSARTEALKFPSSAPPVVPDPVLMEEEDSSVPSFVSKSGSSIGLPAPPAFVAPLSPKPAGGLSSKTQLQQTTARLLHVRTETVLELPQNLTVIHLGKPNDRVPPDIDVSGFPDSDIVSRIHADIRIEGDIFYIEDTGSSNGTYINNSPLPPGNRHRLRSGDRISLGKGDRVSFLFQLA